MLKLVSNLVRDRICNFILVSDYIIISYYEDYCSFFLKGVGNSHPIIEMSTPVFLKRRFA